MPAFLAFGGGGGEYLSPNNAFLWEKKGKKQIKGKKMKHEAYAQNTNTTSYNSSSGHDKTK